MVHLHSIKQLTPPNINDKPIKALVNHTNSILNDAVNYALQDNVIPPAMLQALQNDVFLFSGLKTYTQLKTASQILLNEQGQRKPFAQFAKDVEAIHANYNHQYLQAEYQFATTSAQMAGKWAALDNTGRYYLQYRTAGDSKVRDSHAALNNTTLPADDPFWSEYYPPNGWRCRCNAIEVSKNRYSQTDSSTSITAGIAATSAIDKKGNNSQAIFRFNPGKQKVIFPPTHPYKGDLSKCGNSNLTDGSGQQEKCKVAAELQKQLEDKIAARRNEIKAITKETLAGRKVTNEGIDAEISFGINGIKEALNQGHKHYVAKNEALLNIEKLITTGKYAGSADDTKNRVKQFHYIEVEIANDKSYVVVKETFNNEFHFYSIVDKIKKSD